MARRGSPSSGDAHVSGRGPRRWPLSYFFAVLLILVLLPQLCYKVKLQSQRLLHTKSVFGDNLLPTPWHWHENLVGPQNRTWQRALEILKCSYPGWPRPSHRLSAQNGTQCPSYFHWIDKDLAPWKDTGITSENIEMAKDYAAFKVVIVKGKLYLDLYYSCVQTRAAFTVWGMLLLLEKYDGKVPDVEIMFDCMDRPLIRKTEEEPNEFWSPAPLFRYCSNSKHYDIPWPDWSFWGWSETQLEPWDRELNKIVKASTKKPFRFKEPKAYWRGNPDVGSPLRVELLQCNNMTKFPPAEILDQNWGEELALGKQNSKLEDQCDYRYKIYAEGFAWSVSFKYIIACGSPTLAISPAYYDFYMRELEPWVHYIPVRPAQICAPKLCPAIYRQVKYGEKEVLEAMRIGKAGQDFISKDVSMSNVYDYMLHMLNAYADLQRFTPSIPRTATRVTQNFILCLAKPYERYLLEESRKQVQWNSPPCQMPEIPRDGFKEYKWEAETHDDEGWATQQCTPRRTKPSHNGTLKNETNNGPTKQQI